MNWPTSQDYNEAIQNADSSFSDPHLKSGEVTLNSLGLPVPRSGNFADVYQFKGGDGKMWAVKCFTRKIAGLQERYAKIDDHLAKVKLPFTVGFKYFEEGIRVRGQWFPLLKMEWVEGFTLNEFVRNNADKPKYLHALMQMWAKLTARLREGNLAHADLQHGNVLLVPGDSANKLGLKLIDYDGMWVPALADTHSGEIGHPNFQHPLRLKGRLYNADVDRFPHLVVACALRATLLGGKALWDRFDNGDNLLFKEGDLSDAANAEVFQSLWNLKDDVLCTLVGKMALAAQEPLRKTPWLDDLLLTEEGQRLSKEEEQRTLQLLGVSPHFTARRATTAAPAVNEFSDFDVSDDDEDERAPATRKVKPAPMSRKAKPVAEKAKSKMPLFIGGGVLAVCLIGGIIALVAGGGKSNVPNPQEVAKNNIDSDKQTEAIAPRKKDVGKTRTDDPKKTSPVVGKDTTEPGDQRVADANNTHKPGEIVDVEIANGLKMKFCWVPPGRATLGSPTTERIRRNDETEHEYTAKGFWLGKYAVTQKEWDALMSRNPSEFSIGGNKKDAVAGLNTSHFPVENVSWDDCQEFLKKLNNSAKAIGSLGKGTFVLPHEDDWEYACRGGLGNRRPFYFGDLLNGKQANCKGDTLPWGTPIKGPFLGRTAEVGSYEKAAPHPWGLCDMLGNVWQWCDNSYGRNKSAGVIRGGSWKNQSISCRSATRFRFEPFERDDDLGCRVEFRPDEVSPLAGNPAAAGVDNDFLKPENWEGLEGKWTIDGSTIVGKAENSGKNGTFLCTKQKYKDFEFSCQVRLTNGLGSSGVQFRSAVVDAATFVVSGPQADMGGREWGSLHGFRFSLQGKLSDRGYPIKQADFKSLNVKSADFNDYSVRVIGKRVTIKVNGVVAVDDEFPIIPNDGIIALEMDRPMEVMFKNVVLKRLNETDDPSKKKDDGIAKKDPIDERPGVGFKQIWKVEDGANCNYLEFSGNEAQIASANLGTLRFNSVKDGSVVGSQEASKRPIVAFRALPNDVLVIADDLRTLRFWDRKAAKQLFTITDVPDATSFAIAAQRNEILIARSSGEIKVYSTIDGKLINTIATPLKKLTSIACSENGRAIVIASADGSVYGRNGGIQEFTSLFTVTRVADSEVQLWLSSDTNYCAYVCRGHFAVIQLATKKMKVDFAAKTSATTVAFTSDSRHLIALGPAAMRFWDLEAGEQIGSDAPGGAALALNTDRTLAAVAAANGSLTLYRLPNAPEPAIAKQESHQENERPSVFESKSPVACVAAIPESSALLYACQGDAALYGINETGAAVELGRHDRPIRAVCVSPDGSRAVTGGDDGLLRVWSLGEAKPRDALTGPAEERRKIGAFTGAYSVESYQDGVVFFDEANGKKAVVPIGKPGHRTMLGFKLNLERNKALAERLGAALTDEVILFDTSLTVQLFEGGTCLCELKTGKIAFSVNVPRRPPAHPPAFGQFKPAYSLKQHTGPVVACAISRDGARAVSVGADSLLCEWDIKEGKLLRKFPIPASLAVAYLADGKAVLLGTSSESALIFDLEKQKRVMSLSGHRGKVRAVCLTLAGKHGYTAGDDGAIRMWDLATGALVRTLTRHTSPVVSLATMPNGEFMVSADSSKQIYLWDADRIRGRLGGEYMSDFDVRTVAFNELSDSLVLGTDAAGGAGAVRYVGLKIESEPAVVTIVVKPKVESTGRKAGDVVEVPIANGMTMKFCWVPAGTATLSSPATEKEHMPDEKEHEFTTKGFWLGKYPVTQAEWTAVMGSNPSHFSENGTGSDKVAGVDTSRFPVENVSWNDCQDFLKKLNEKVAIPNGMGKGKYALPQEDEWEYACRGGKGNKQPFYFGDVLNGVQANCRGDVPYGTTTKGPHLGHPTPVGSYEKISPHPWGLSDMLGNVHQWCQSSYNNQDNRRIMRGGSWTSESRYCRCAIRAGSAPDNHGGSGGLRVAFVPDSIDDGIGWTVFGGRKSLPELFQANPKAIFDKDALSTKGRYYVITKKGDYLAKDFKFELVYTLNGGETDQIVFVGIGEGDRNGAFNEPNGSVFLAIHPPNLDGGWVRLSKEPVKTFEGFGNVAKEGTHRVTIEKKGDAVTFAIYIDNDRTSKNLIEKRVPDIKKIGTLLNNKNTHIFFGGGGAYKQFRLVEMP